MNEFVAASSRLSAACAVHASICSLVASQSNNPAWEEYGQVFLSAGIQDAIKSLIHPQALLHAGHSSKKRKTDTGGAACDEQQGLTMTCSNCDATVPAISLRIACLDGTTFGVLVYPHGLIAEVRASIGRSRGREVVGTANEPAIELFMRGTEDPLSARSRIDALGIEDGTVLFMLPRRGWWWSASGTDTGLSEEGLVASAKNSFFTYFGRPLQRSQVASGGEVMTTGRHYWEVRCRCAGPVVVGAARPGTLEAAYYIFATGAAAGAESSGKVWGRAPKAESTPRQGIRGFATGDRIGCLLDLDAGWMCFYRNGDQWGESFTSNVTGPLTRMAQPSRRSDAVTVIPMAASPDGDPQIALCVTCLDGAASVTVNVHCACLVNELKTAIAVATRVVSRTYELCLANSDGELAPTARIDALGITEGTALRMVTRMISLQINCVDGGVLTVDVDRAGTITEVKTAITSARREVPPYELCLTADEEHHLGELAPTARIDALGITEGTALRMVTRMISLRITHVVDGAVFTVDVDRECLLAEVKRAVAVSASVLARDDLPPYDLCLTADEELAPTARIDALGISDGAALLMVTRLISLRVTSQDGGTFTVDVDRGCLVSTLKAAVARARDVPLWTTNLFKFGTENALPANAKIAALGIKEGCVLRMVARPAQVSHGWCWADSNGVALSGESLVATTSISGHVLVAGGETMTEGRHYWEVEVTKSEDFWVYIGAVRPGLDPNASHANTTAAYYIRGTTSSLHGNGKFIKADKKDELEFAEGDHIGVLLDLDVGSMNFYCNGVRRGSGFTGVTGPLVRAAQLYDRGDAVSALPGAAVPPGVGC